MKRSLISLFICLMQLFIINVFGQSTIDGKEIFQIYAPETYALARYGDIPVDYSTGVPAISVPLMSISDKDIILDISLSYHAAGIKVDQEATWVGLGWALNAGGVITRQVRGAEDCYNSVNGKFSQRPVIQDYNYVTPLSNYLSSLATDLNLIGSSSYNIYDGEPDIFYYNFCGKSGKFFLDNNVKGCFFKYEDFKVEFPNNDLFRITDQAGVKYEFTTSSYDIIPVDNLTQRSTWHLTKITSPSGGEITLTYESRYSETARRRQHSTCFIEVNPESASFHQINSTAYHAGLLASSYCNYALLSKITSKSGNYINFNLSATSRRDMSNSTAKALEEIVLYNNKNEIQKRVSFGYDYFEANTSQRYKTYDNKEPADYNYLNYRLRLKTVKEISKSGISGGTYCFEYYGDDNPATDDAYTLPYRLSARQDHWGYYNHSSNVTIFPNNSVNKTIGADQWLDWYIGGRSTHLSPVYGRSSGLACNVVTGGANRETDFEAVKAGSLNKIIYPTGGYTKFDYEAHRVSTSDYSAGGGIRIKQIESCDEKGNKIIKDYEYETYSGHYLEYYYYSSYSPYHTLIYNTYTPTDLQSMHQVLMAMGVPPGIVYKEKLHVIRIDGESRLKLGIGAEALYSKVTEKSKGAGQTEYYYSCMDDFSNNWNTIILNGTYINDAFTFTWVQTVNYPWYDACYFSTQLDSHSFPYPESIGNDWRNRLLNCKKVYNNDGVLVMEDSIFYKTAILQAIPNYKALRLADNEYMYARSYTIGGSVNVSKEVNRQYIPGQGMVRVVKENDYTSVSHKQITENRTWDSSGKLVTTKYYYPPEYGEVLLGLKNSNILVPVDVRSYKENKLLSGMQIKYDSKGQVDTKYRFESDVTDMPFNSQNPYTFSPYLWNTYYTFGLLQTQLIRSGVSNVYLWGYKNQYPIAEIKNATYDQVKAIINEATLTSIASKDEPSTSDWVLIDGLRALPNTLVTTYTYKPLVGMLTSTDPSGIITYYEYDDFGRLKETYIYKDNIIAPANKQTLQKYEYHYHNQ
ncbi:MAG: hypothetical protein ACK5KN_07180 [Dysgonomonas sp.]|uniref:hypothetical protein n=1 Tax=Dysgonomonas sp. TaxID=1891233 RepID=UPI003A889D53